MIGTSKCLTAFVALYTLSYSSASHNNNKKCTLQDSKCLREKSFIALETFVDGIPELDIERIDKMFIEKIDIKSDSVTKEMRNVEIAGFKNATVTDVSFDEFLKVVSLSFETTFHVKSDYTLVGLLFRQPIIGAGEVNLIIKNVRVNLVFLYDIIKQKNGKHKLDFQDYRYGSIVNGGVVYDYKNMYNGNKQMSDRFHAFLNKNWIVITSTFGRNLYNAIIDRIYKAIKTYIGSNYNGSLTLQNGTQQHKVLFVCDRISDELVIPTQMGLHKTLPPIDPVNTYCTSTVAKTRLVDLLKID